MEQLNKNTYKAITASASSFSARHKLNKEDVLSFLHEKIVPYIKKYDKSFNVPEHLYIRKMCNLLCLNYLRDEANSITIDRGSNYVPIAEQSLLKLYPGMQDAPIEDRARVLGLSTSEYSKARQANADKRTISLDEHAFLQNFIMQAEQNESTLVAYMQAMQEDDYKLLEKYAKTGRVTAKNTNRFYSIIASIIDLFLQTESAKTQTVC